MFVVINIDPGSTLNELMSFMTQRTITFSVTDHISKLVDKNVVGERRECSTQTDEFDQQPPAKKPRLCNGGATALEECASPCSSATPSEPTSNETKPQIMWLGQTSEENATTENTTDIIDEETTNEIMQQQLMQALFNNIKQGAMENYGGDDPEEGDLLDPINPHDFSAIYPSSSPTAIRFKPTYASTKRGVCQVCNREVSLITTHRKRHAITHLGFKTLKCAVCHKFFSRQDLASGHFKKDHPESEFMPFVDTMSAEDEKQLSMMMELCFPAENKRKKRTSGVKAD